MKNLSLNQSLWLFFTGLMLLNGYLMYYHGWENWNNTNKEIAEINRQFEIKKSDYNKITERENNIRQLEDQIEKANERYRSLLQEFPQKDTVPNKLRDLYSATRRSENIPVSFRPMQSVDYEYYRENLYDVTLTTNYHQLGRFFEEMANQEYPVSLDNVSISYNTSFQPDSLNPGTTHSTISRFLLKTYTSKEDSKIE